MIIPYDVDTEVHDSHHPFHYSPVNVERGVLVSSFPVVHDQLLCLADVEGEVGVLAPYCQVSDLLPIYSIFF